MCRARNRQRSSASMRPHEVPGGIAVASDRRSYQAEQLPQIAAAHRAGAGSGSMTGYAFDPCTWLFLASPALASDRVEPYVIGDRSIRCGKPGADRDGLARCARRLRTANWRKHREDRGVLERTSKEVSRLAMFERRHPRPGISASALLGARPSAAPRRAALPAGSRAVPCAHAHRASWRPAPSGNPRHRSAR